MPESCIVKAMRNQNLHHHHYHHQLILLMSLATLKSSLIFNALILMNGQALAKDDDVCNASWLSPTCRPMFTNRTSFPFVSSPECGNVASSFFISGCTDDEKRTWPKFVDACTTSNILLLGNHDITLGPPSVTGFSDQFLLNLSTYTTSTSAFGILNLTWSNPTQLNINKNACKSPAPLSQIAHYLPQSINLTSFARSAFQFTPSNIILLFNCTSLSPVPHNLHKNSPACSSYENGCDLLSKNKSNCYQYIPETKQLNLTQAMESLKCENAMFFVAQQLSNPVSQWKPGLIELNWSTTNNPWMASNLKSCVGCLQTNGSCGYNRDDDFLCYCSNNRNSVTNCSANNISEGLDSTARDPDKDCHSRMFCHMQLTIGLGAAVFAIALSLSLFCIYKRRKFFMKASVPCSSINKSWMKKPSFLSRQDPISAKEMSYQEIMHATESFAETHMLGDGGFGAVYEGVLADGRKVAVKRLYHDNYRRMEHFYNEIKVLSNLNHPSLVKLYGFCCEDDKELLLVFEYAPQGTVSDHLHNASKPPMSWNLRLDIACETADALSYLHNSVIPPIYHRDVKTTNILLDEGFHAKLADFGLSKFVPLKATHVSTTPQGTPGYLDPDYHQCYQLTDKSDVYSLGVVLMELISAKPAVDMSRERGEINLSTLAVMKIKCGQLEQLVDPNLEMKRNPCVERSIKRVVELAFQCLYTDRDERPSMSFVAETLAEIRREHAQNEDGDGEDLPNTHMSTHSTPTTCQSCVSNGSNKPSQDSPCSVFFSSSSSNPPSILG